MSIVIKRCDKPINSHNHLQYSPYLVTDSGIVYILASFYKTLLPETKDRIDALNAILVDTLPNKKQIYGNLFNKVYHIYYDMFGVDKWYPYVYEKYEAVLVKDPWNQINVIQATLKKYGCVFCRTLTTSGKRYFKPRPMKTVEDVLRFMSVPEISKRLETEKLVIRPWVEIKHEFRVFVVNTKVAGISDYHVPALVVDDQDALQLGQQIYLKSIEMIDILPYTTFVLDFYLNDKEELHLLEINPGGKFHASGSGFFETSEPDAQEIEFRVKVI